MTNNSEFKKSFTKKTFSSKYFSKLFIIFFYILILAFFLYLPTISRLFFKTDNVINVYTFTDMISSETAHDFESETGKRVNLKYYDTNEELYAKFKINDGKGYDLITPSDYLVDLLKKSDLLARIDKNKLTHFNELDKRLTGHYFDPKNNFSIPYFWSMDGIIYKKDLFKDIKVDWDLIFNKPNNLNFKICMLDSARETTFIVADYLFNKVNNLTDDDYLKIKATLIKQRSWVEIYMLASLQYYLLSGVVPIAVTSSAFAKKILEVSDDYEYVLPEKGALLIIDNLAIPKYSDKTDLVHRFIDFLISKKTIAYNSNLFGYNPSNTKAYSLLQKRFVNNKDLPKISDLWESLSTEEKNELKDLEDLKEWWGKRCDDEEIVDIMVTISNIYHDTDDTTKQLICNFHNINNRNKIYEMLNTNVALRDRLIVDYGEELPEDIKRKEFNINNETWRIDIR